MQDDSKQSARSGVESSRASASSDSSYYLFIGDQQQGPYSLEELKALWLAGKIGEDGLYAQVGMTAWEPIATLRRDLFLNELNEDQPGGLPEAVTTESSTGADSQHQEVVLNEPVQRAQSESPKAETIREVRIQLAFGERIPVIAIKLYSEFLVEQASALRARAMKQLGGWSSGLGALGSLGHVVLTSAVVGAIEAAVSKDMSKEGIALLAQALEAENRTRARGQYLPVAVIVNLRYPIPALWRVPFERETSVIEKGFLSDREKQVRVPCAYVHNGDDFVWLKTSTDEEFAVRWAHVAKYEVVSGLNSDELSRA